MALDPEALRQQIPYYLTAEPARKELVEGLKALSEGATDGYFFPAGGDPHANTMLQGDGWRGFQVFSFTSGAQNLTRGIVLSNSCDISPENERVLPPKVTFAPLVKLARIKARFEEHGLRAEQIEGRLQAIRAQSVTSIFYLPASGPLEEEYVALLDDLHSMPVEAHRQAAEKVFTLSMAGFYLFVFKLSVHFCRLQENVDRSMRAATV
ncbi:hypothetical protein ACFO5X_10955 [Seohaeicola nanhaiensis]|uniref:Uncharacterized protein n=1 Tax=Seohaeicola nanhaiensis TaxID=1387282 RepID=A0ABV9KGT2_9RHOB